MREGFECVKNVQVSKQLASLLKPYKGCPRGAMGIAGDKSIVDHIHKAKDYMLKGQDENFVCIPESWYELCVTALERLQKAEKNEPLTREELETGEDRPIWVVCRVKKRMYSGWAVYEKSFERAWLPGIDYDWFDINNYGTEWLAYSRPPEEARNG